MTSAFPRGRARLVPLLASVVVLVALLAAFAPLNFFGSGGSAQASGPELTFDLSCSPEALVDGPVAFIYTLENTGDEPLTKVSVIDERLGDISSSFPATLAPGEKYVYIGVYMHVKESDPRPFTNSATATYDPAAPVTDSCTVDVAHLTLTKTAVSTADSTTYTITLKNDGSTLLSRVYVTDTRLGYISSYFPQFLAPGQEVVRQFTVEPPEPCDNVVEALYQTGRELVYASAECGGGEIGFLLVKQLDETGAVFDANNGTVTFYICLGDVVITGCDAGNAIITTTNNPTGLIPLAPGIYTACVVEPAGFVVDPPACQATQLLDGLTATITFITIPEGGDGEACTPGFWKNTRQHLDEWHEAGYDPSEDFTTIFGFNNIDTLGDAVNAKGGTEGKLLKFSVAALLAAGHPGVDFGLTEAEVIDMAFAAYNAGDWHVFDGFFDDEECPL